ncbi:23S rRNA (guanosine(2251)-2'-O)-methyltransferase RlmB [Zooshikella harenae]|uniref:23S rRNA (guanosine-2'-O-)-methyltransferase RlmB n=1 Tax=Zooshikella harenae TaxID=2827238 RepID=A0ABS5ZA28_9GAMM|nr:23S rRNA (guanosine(2251)-2'-O)-methyltransferase RlmB [Zooshikella harenae]MBU2710906.1 23S rRNA (guanosine(2251)-2'-O)-methyltransferase RlmB [Zooshikella harenae]
MSNTDVVYGIHAVLAQLNQRPDDVIEILLQQGREGEQINKIQVFADKQHITCSVVSRKVLDQYAKTHQGVVVKVRASRGKTEEELVHLLDTLEEPPFILLLDSVTDPHNLGACLRSADAAGIHAVIAPKDKAVGLTPVVRKVACGAAESVAFFSVTNLARTLRMLQDRGIWITGMAGEATQDLYTTDLTGPTALVLGAEGKGLRRLTRELCDQLTKIPMAGLVSSLNVSVAAGICLFEAVRQRQLKGN